jgi:hypothetical protein
VEVLAAFEFVDAMALIFGGFQIERRFNKTDGKKAIRS